MQWREGLAVVLVVSFVAAFATEEDSSYISSTEAAEYQKWPNTEHHEALHEKLPGEKSEEHLEQTNEEKNEEFEHRRSRQRSGGKRRRRMRKRMRTTPEPFIDDEVEAPNLESRGELTYERPRRVYEDGDLSAEEPLPRRRPGKRRRRPQRRYQERNRGEYQETRPREGAGPDGPRKRRKGSRKRIRDPPLRANFHDYRDETQQQNPESDEQVSHAAVESTPETVHAPSSVHQEHGYSVIFDSDQMYEPGEQTPDTLQVQNSSDYETFRTPIQSTPDSDKPRTEEGTIVLNSYERNRTESISELPPKEQFEEIEDYPPIKQEVSTVVPEESKPINTAALGEIVREEERNTTNESANSKESSLEDKIFDRKKLFPSSRRQLPPTSAVIRRRLRPKLSDERNSIPPLGQPDESQKDGRNTIDTGNEISQHRGLIPQGFTTAPEVISPTQLIKELKSQTFQNDQEDSTTEEPNYPKFKPIIRKNNQNLRNEDKIFIKKVNSTDKIPSPEQETTEQKDETVEQKYETEIPDRDEIGMKEEMTTTYKPITVNTEETLKYEALDIPNVKDDILDLLKSESGSSRLARILELRNMTLVELIEHRERGSSQLHLSDIFKRRHTIMENQKKLENEKKAEENNEPASKKNPITFPSEEILGSFPKFLLEQIDKKNFSYDEAVRFHSQESKKALESKINDTREPRLFEQPTDTADTPTEKILSPYPGWKIFPNPKLTPVSVHGHYEEIYLTKLPPTEKVTLPQDTNEVILLGENEVPIIHRNEIGSRLSAESVKSKSGDRVSSFRRIPPGMKSAIIVSGAILLLAIFGFLSVLISCRVRQRRARLRAKQDILCEHLQNEDFMNSQRSLSPVLTKTREPVFSQGIHSNTTSNRHYYLWRTLRKTFQYD